MKRIIVGVLALACVAQPALAGDSNYKLIINNDTSMIVTINQYDGGCISWDGTAPSFPMTLQPRTSSAAYIFYRASHCHGLNGQLGLTAVETFGGPGDPPSPQTQFYMDFSAGGTMDVTISGGWVDAATSYSFTPYASGDTSNITFNLLNKPDIDLVGALSGQCYDEAAASGLMGILADQSDTGTVTLTSAQGYDTEFVSTAMVVTAPIWGFRSPTFSPDEPTVMQSGELLSKMENLLQKLRTTDARNGAWRANGPRVGGTSGPVSSALRLLAATSSDSPKSQFVSVALDYKTASGFGQGTVVYAFQHIPDSEIIGLKACGTVQGGEVQVQPKGGTPIWNLMRSTDGVNWQAWDEDNEEWVASTVVPSNGALP